MSSFRVCPGNGADNQAVGETRMEFDYYFDDGDPEGDGMKGWPEYFQFVRKVAMEDFELCETAQGNLEKGVYSQGCLNGVKESGVVRKLSLSLSLSLSRACSGSVVAPIPLLCTLNTAHPPSWILYMSM